MKCTVVIDEMRDEEVVIYAHKRTKFVEEITRFVSSDNQKINGYLQGEIVKLDINDVSLFSLDCGKLYAICDDERYLLKLRLYAVEKLLDNNFIKINQSSIANIRKMKKFDVTIGGTIKVIFKNGQVDYVSRRNVKSVKERLGL